MRTAISAAVLLAFANAGIAAQDLTDTAQVISSTPIVERITEPRQECWQEPAAAPAQDRSVVAPIVGGVVGGLLGNQVGRGSGRTAATVVGAGAGAYAGNEIEKNNNRSVTYQVRVRMNDGTYRTVRESAQPALAVGQKVRVTEQGIIAAG